ncbi:hypothetical protein A3D80_01370 [Candidatus Roizmanbacteria bacterium RIFCSPHIGHO2_02_FULL_40_13b]|uniref:Metallo-beta-lactamase domain-containing protein n=1 Tax=Candidatus Roizmanbacteria bacterium RIFCSPHIGHO2_01_FULL_39_24 TaxID=1802032 RepID=A0A1F7GEF8_9BACT|nr:MAG: hypothetical protein A2799_03375 [Candidatus Roizmanbacteria bacterium RIFCSPHIGHO2_01_FULL_39_24]OGK26218.1 MAG: hypothetical protein A3D80_01370 [Candidatus Roizmanbacteria bacterium RIFCSPHIGHO2_02_FULL_40_13b]OGK50370.1 MAG: hypothetical protein A3A56_00310 [Candidatus Roizmanbacteria bacterium RIFCSPLOWO2_01_FULL_40_32]OGK56214.1 MAG: hypothetical protein A3H83_01705 [Candidatus Roizmanbacteria bacterium RIFCSPLOWO2_02_FULL_39_8]
MDQFKLRFVPLGGIVDVTKNMYLYEIYRNGELEDIIVVDCGIGFPKEKELGVDFVIPDISYLLDKTDKIRAILLTHGHEDHISALRFHYEALGKPPVYGSKLTALLVEEKFKEYGMQLKVTEIAYRQQYTFGSFQARFIHVTHSIPDPTHIVLKTPVGTFYHGPDFKLDLTPPYGPPPDFYEIAKAGEEGIDCLLSDCLGVGREGFTLSESIVGKTFEDEIRTTKGKFIMTTFSSNISRIRQCAEAAVKFNRSIAFMGRSMRGNTDLAREIGYFPIPDRYLIDERKAARMRPGSVCIIAAGSQGQIDSAMSKLANDQNKSIKIAPGDKVFFSSDPIPGQEDDVNDLVERLYARGAEVIYSDIAEGLHASGHGNQEDLKLLARLTRPKHLIPIGGTVLHQKMYANMADKLGFGPEQIHLLREGQTYVFERGSAYAGEPVDTRNIFVDAYGVGDVGSTVLRDRKTLSTDGIVLAVIIVDNAMKMVGKPQFISHGFIFKNDEQAIFAQATTVVERVLRRNGPGAFNDSIIRSEVSRNLEQVFQSKTGREPLVSVEIIKL